MSSVPSDVSMTRRLQTARIDENSNSPCFRYLFGERFDFELAESLDRYRRGDSPVESLAGQESHDSTCAQPAK